MAKTISVRIIRPIDPKPGFIDTHFDFLQKHLAKLVNGLSNESRVFQFNGLVSESTGVSDIPTRIIQKVLSSDFIIAVTSGLNPNVMFELGLRLAQRKPTIIIQDDSTELPFDINTFEVLSYPRMFEANKLPTFDKNFREKFIGTWEDFEINHGATSYIAKLDGSNLVDPEINKMSLNEAAESMGKMLQYMQDNFILVKTDDIFDTIDFNHSVQVTPETAAELNKIKHNYNSRN